MQPSGLLMLKIIVEDLLLSILTECGLVSGSHLQRVVAET